MASEVKWIKIVTDIFDDEKILLIESMPEADSIIVIWFKLLCFAGKQNNGGVLMLNDRIPYTDEMLATVFRRPINVVRMAFKVFEQFDMIEIINNTVTIPVWERLQSLDAYERIKEKDRKRKVLQRQQKKLLLESSTDKSTDSSTDKSMDVHTTEQEEDKDIDKEQEESVGDDPDGMQQISRDHSEILDAAEAAGFPKNTATWDKIIDLYAEYGKENVLAGISACVEQAVIKVAYLRKCCANIASGEGKKEDRDPLLPKDHEFMGW